MEPVVVRFYGALNDFLSESRRARAFACAVRDRRSVKDLIEALGPPHCEVFLVMVDDASVPFDHVVEGGERIAVYPHLSELDATGLVAAGEPLPEDARFALDGHLGRLAAYLRALGFDVAHDRDAEDAAIAQRAADEDRVVLTRDLGLLKRSLVRHGYFVRSDAPREQLAEVVRRFRLLGRTAAFTRCLRCNTPLADASPDEVRDVVHEGVHARFSRFKRCPTCGRAFWAGSHHERLLQFLDPFLTSPAEDGHS